MHKMRLKKHYLYSIALVASIIGMIAFILDFGFVQSEFEQQLIDGFYFLVIAIGLLSTFARYFKKPDFSRKKVFIFDLLSVLYTLYIFYMYLFVGEAFTTDLILENPLWVIMAVILTFFREFFDRKINFSRAFLNPAQLFILSFFLVILSGSFLLMLPNATNEKISFLDALFTSTSAVCVTGLIVVDTATYFTTFGKVIILFLIQIGGLGILTFASYFSYFFKGVSTYESQLTLSEMTNSGKIGEVFKTLKYIILITLTIEGISALMIFFTLRSAPFETFTDRVFFSVFHAVSAFCNAGFSTLTNNLYEDGFRFNYALQLIVIITLVFGGLGFPIVANMLEFVKHKVRLILSNTPNTKTHRPWVLNINSRITLITTIVLIVTGFVLYFLFEYNHTLSNHTSLWGKIVTALFGSTTPRTAGFNTVDMTALSFPTVMITFLLMWIGASPASTGGGIKTSTFAIATLNILSLAKGKNRIEIYRREISDISVRRAFATIALSLMVIGAGITIITVSDPEKGLLNIGFECFSAYSTVGLSLGITAGLSNAGKLIIIAIMFIGRVSMLSIVIAFFKKVKHKNYRYPTEEITIN